MRIYVAGASSEIERARRVMAALRAEGHEITFDWTIDFESNEGLSDVQRAAYADADFQGVFLARRVVLLVPVSPSVTQALGGRVALRTRSRSRSSLQGVLKIVRGTFS